MANTTTSNTTRLSRAQKCLLVLAAVSSLVTVDTVAKAFETHAMEVFTRL